MGCDTVSLCYCISVFRKILLPSFLISPRRRVFLGLLDSEHLGTMILWSIRNHSCNYTLSHPRRLESTTKSPWELQILLAITACQTYGYLQVQIGCHSLKNSYFLWNTEQIVSSSGISNFYEGGIWFMCWPGHWLLWPRFCVTSTVPANGWHDSNSD